MSFNVIKNKNNYDGRGISQIRLWDLILTVADERYNNKEVYWILDGFAIAGAIIKIKDNGFKMEKNNNYWQTEKEWLSDRKKYLLPHKFSIKTIFNEAFKRWG